MAGMGSEITESVIHERSGIKHCLIGDESKETLIPSVNNVFALRGLTFTFKYHPNICEQKAQIAVHFNFRREFAKSLMDKIFMNFKDQNHFLNYICFIFIY